MGLLQGFASALIPLVLVCLGIVTIFPLVALWRRTDPLHKRRSPLTQDLLRPPGESLRKAIHDAQYDAHSAWTILTIIPITIYATHLTQSYIFGHEETALRFAMSLLVCFIFMPLYGSHLLKAFKKRDTLVRGLDGEMATGQELDQLMRDGCFVFHDIQTDSVGNIDHIVVSPSGVFSVETKAVGKPKGDSNAEAVVNYAEGTIRFPDRFWRIPVAQLEGQQRWLSNYLSRRVNQKINVEPMLALPGWKIERRGHGVYIFNPRNSPHFFVGKPRVLSDQVVRHIADHLEQLSRNVSPAGAEQRPVDS